MQIDRKLQPTARISLVVADLPSHSAFTGWVRLPRRRWRDVEPSSQAADTTSKRRLHLEHSYARFGVYTRAECRQIQPPERKSEYAGTTAPYSSTHSRHAVRPLAGGVIYPIHLLCSQLMVQNSSSMRAWDIPRHFCFVLVSPLSFFDFSC
jgi:hypothetical protein